MFRLVPVSLLAFALTLALNLAFVLEPKALPPGEPLHARRAAAVEANPRSPLACRAVRSQSPLSGRSADRLDHRLAGLARHVGAACSGVVCRRGQTPLASLARDCREAKGIAG